MDAQRTDESHAGSSTGHPTVTKVTVAICAAAVIVVGVTLVRSSRQVTMTTSGTIRTGSVIAAPPRPPSPVPVSTTIAEVSGPVAYSDEPGGSQVGTLPMGKWWQETKQLPVIETRGDWLRVRLPQRPNGLTGWIAASDATLSRTTYGILIDVTQHRLQLYDSGRVVADVPAGVGTEDDPTPTGQFYVMDVAASPGHGWGPFILDTNAHSEAILNWEGQGDAFTAIHGPVGGDAAIGTEGAAISHGCVRLHYDDLAQLSPVPAGAPVVIVS